MARQPLVGQELLIAEASLPHTGTPQWVRLIRIGHQLDSRDLYITHNTRRGQESHGSGWMRNHNPNKTAAADPHLRPHGRWDRQVYTDPK